MKKEIKYKLFFTKRQILMRLKQNTVRMLKRRNPYVCIMWIFIYEITENTDKIFLLEHCKNIFIINKFNHRLC